MNPCNCDVLHSGGAPTLNACSWECPPKLDCPKEHFKKYTWTLQRGKCPHYS